MQKTSFHILRVGTAITFLWIGILIIQNPAAWAGYVDLWVENILPVSLETVMILNAILDIIIGALLLVDVRSHWAGLAAAIHMIIVLTVSGITNTTVRDIAILAAGLAIFADSVPLATKERLMFWKKTKSL